MSEYFFAVHNSHRPLAGGRKTAKMRDKIAKRIGGKGCGYVYWYDSSRHEYCAFGYCPNRGAPFDAQTAKAIQESWKEHSL